MLPPSSSSSSPPPPEILAVPQFVVKRRINVTEIAAVDLSRDPPFRPTATSTALIGCRLSFFDESASLRLAFETGDAREALIAAIAKVWEEDFGVELEINDDADN